MAFPQVATTNNGIDGTNTTTHTVNLPSGISSGDLLIAVISIDASVTIGWPNEGTDWIVIGNGLTGSGSLHTCDVAYRIANGSEGSTISVSSSTSQQSGHATYRITGWHGTTPPELTSGSGSDTQPDPPSETASWGGSEDNLFIAGCGWDGGDTSVSTYPTSYTSNQVSPTGGGPGGAGCAIATLESAADTDNPAVYTLDGSEDWSSFTIVVRPAAAGGGRTTKNTDSNPLGIHAGMGRRINTP